MSKAVSPEAPRRSYSSHSLPSRFSPKSPAYQSTHRRNTQFREFLDDQKNDPTLTTSKQFLGDNCISILIEFLKDHFNFSTIDLSDSSIGTKHFALICKEIKHFPKLLSIKARGNLLGKDNLGLRALADLLVAVPEIKEIDLRNNQIGKRSGRVLAKIIQEGKNLQKLDLRFNRIGDEEAAYILEALRSNAKNMQVLLGGNGKISEKILFGINRIVLDAQLNTAEADNTAREENTKNFVFDLDGMKSDRTVKPSKYNSPHRKQSKARTPNISPNLKDKQYATFEPTNWSRKGSVSSIEAKTQRVEQKKRKRGRAADVSQPRSKTPVERFRSGSAEVRDNSFASKSFDKRQYFLHEFDQNPSADAMIKKLRQLLYDEKQRSRQNSGVIRDQMEKYLNEERRTRAEVERNCSQLAAELKERGNKIAQLEQNYNKLLQECSQIKEENARLLSNSQKSKAETRSRNPLQETFVGNDTYYKEENQRLERQVKELKSEIQLVSAQLREKAKQNEAKVRIEERQRFEEELQRLRIIQREEAGFNFDSANEKLINENKGLKVLVEKLRSQLAESLTKNEKMKEDIQQMDVVVLRLEKDINQAYVEMDRIRELHHHEVEKLLSDHKLERSRWLETQAFLQSRVQELEISLAHAKDDTQRSQQKFKQLMNSLQGNVKRAFSKAISENE